MCAQEGATTCRASATKRPGQKVRYDVVFHSLLAERKGTTSKSQRATLSKSIRKHLRRAFREQRNGWIEHVLDEFKDLDWIIHHARAPVHPCSTRKDEECPGPDEFATFWMICLHRKLVLNRPFQKFRHRKEKQFVFEILNVSPWLNYQMHGNTSPAKQTCWFERHCCRMLCVWEARVAWTLASCI